MLKFVVLLFLVSTPVLGARDSVAYFYSAKKVNVLINERGFNSRIQQFMDALNEKSSMLLVSEDHDIRLGCAREEDRATCTFTFYPSSSVSLVDKKLYVHKQLLSFGITEDVEFEMIFQSSMKDQIQLRLSDGQLIIFASK